MAKASKKYKTAREKMGFPIGPNSSKKNGPKAADPYKYDFKEKSKKSKK